MKRTLLTLAASALIALPTLATAQEQPSGDRPQRPAGAGRMDPAARVQFLTEKLGLDTAQQEKIKAIYEKYGPQLREAWSKGKDNLTDEDKAKLRETMKAQQEEVFGVLTPEQQTKMKELHQQFSQGGGKFGRGGKGGKGGKRGENAGGDASGS